MALEPDEIARLRELLGDTLCALLRPDGGGSVTEQRLLVNMGIAETKLSELLSWEITNGGGLTVARGADGVSFGKSWKDGCREGTRPWAAE